MMLKCLVCTFYNEIWTAAAKQHDRSDVVHYGKSTLPWITALDWQDYGYSYDEDYNKTTRKQLQKNPQA